MTGKNSGKHGIFEFLEHGHDPLRGRVNSSRAIQAELLWEIARQHGKKTVAGGVPMSYPPRPAAQFPGFFLGDFLSPADAPDFASDPDIFAELEKEVGPYRPWSTAIHDGGNEAGVLADLHDFLEQHLKAVQFLMNRCDWDLFIFDLMATDRFQHELWHVWDLTHRAARGRERELAALRPKLIAFWQTLDRGIGAIEADLPPDAALLHDQRPRLRADRALRQFQRLAAGARVTSRLQDSFYVKQKHWFYRRGVTPEWIYGVMSRLGLGNHRVSRFRGKQEQPAGSAGRVAFPVAAAHRLVADAGLCTGELRPDLPEPQGAPAAWVRRPRGRPSAARGPEGRADDDSPSRDGRAAGRACLRARRAVPWPARALGPRPDRGAHRLAVSHDRPARLHDEQGDRAGVRADRRPSDGGDPDRLRAGVPGWGRSLAAPSCSTSPRRCSTCWGFPSPTTWTAAS